MKNKLKAEAHVMERLIDLLEEGSVTHLMQEDDTFAGYIDDLYSRITATSMHLRRVQLAQ